MRLPKGALAVLALLSSLGCFELSPPVEERLSLKFLPGGAVEVTVETLIADTRDRFENNAAARNRIREVRRLYTMGQDPWVRRFEALDWEYEKISWEKAWGGLVRVQRMGVLSDPSLLPRFFADLSLAVSYERGEGFAELSLVPLSPARANRQDRESFTRLADEWVAVAAEYERLLGNLYQYLEDHPDRVRPCLAEVYETCLSEEEKANHPGLSPEEEALMESLGDPMGKLLEFVQVKPGEARSADELSKLIYDPFPGATEVSLPGELLEVDGFERATATTVAHSGLGFWRAVERLDGAFVFPDPLPRLLLCLRDGEKAPKLSLDGVIATPRRSSPVPTEEELRSALDAALTPAPLYRVRWKEAER